MTATYPTYEELEAKRIQYGETNDCAVKAIAQVAGISYEKAHNLCRHHGRIGRKGTNTRGVTIPALESLGFELEDVYVGRLTIGNLCLPKDQIYVVLTSSHIIGYRDGKALDYTAGGRHRVKRVIKLTRSNTDVTQHITSTVKDVPSARKKSVQRTWEYKCDCDTHFVSTIIHNKIRLGKQTYSCKSCGKRIVTAK